jgi:lipoate synthase
LPVTGKICDRNTAHFFGTHDNQKYIPVHVWEESTCPRKVIKTCRANSLQYYGTMTMGGSRCKRFCALIIVKTVEKIEEEFEFQSVADTPSSVRI